MEGAPPASRSSLRAGLKLKDLPPSLQAHILQALDTPGRQPPIQISLGDAKKIKAILSPDLLAVAQSSPHLAAVTAEALGTRAAFLTANVAKDRLPQWLSVLAPSVRAISTWDSHFDQLESLGSLKYRPQAFWDELCQQALALFNALAKENVAVEVLDLKSVPFETCPPLQTALEDALVRALERNSTSLRELALPVSEVCARALERVSLPVLHVAEFEMKGTMRAIEMEREASTKSFLQMMGALEGHRNRGRNLTTVRELRLICPWDLPCRDAVESGCSPAFFEAFSKLYVDTVQHDVRVSGAVPIFVSLFPKLELLHWNGVLTARELEAINRNCAHIRELHLTQLGDRGSNLTELCDFLTATQGKLRTFVLREMLSAHQMKRLGENSPNLAYLETEIGPENLSGLSLLLGTYCRKLKGLSLLFPPNSDESLGAEGWGAFADAVCSASEELCEVALEVGDEMYPMESAVESMVGAIETILESLGVRAKVLRIQVPTEVAEYRILIDALCRVLGACSRFTKNLECLHVELGTADVEYFWNSDNEKVEKFTALLKARKMTMDAAPHLYSLYLGGLDEEAAENIGDEFLAS